MPARIFLACKLTGIDWAFSIDVNRDNSYLSVAANTERVWRHSDAEGCPNTIDRCGNSKHMGIRPKNPSSTFYRIHPKKLFCQNASGCTQNINTRTAKSTPSLYRPGALCLRIQVGELPLLLLHLSLFSH